MARQNDCCILEQCDIFDFMLKHVGLSVLHPGGFEATRKMADACGINNQTKVLDIACGKGTSAVYLAQKYGCRVVGIDVSPDLVSQAKALAKKKGLVHRVRFQKADALDLPFLKNEFDVTVAQAVLVLVKNKKKAVQEALRVVKPGGRLGWVELSWKKPPTARFMKDVSDVLCAACMQNVLTFQHWQKLFRGTGIQRLKTLPFPLGGSRLSGMLENEGLLNLGKVLYRYLTRAPVRERMQIMNRFFKAHADHFAYGIYVGEKKKKG